MGVSDLGRTAGLGLETSGDLGNLMAGPHFRAKTPSPIVLRQNGDSGTTEPFGTQPRT